MSILSTLLRKEENRNNNMILEYMNELDTLPKGSISPKNVKGNTYYYLTFRDGNKVVSKYLGKNEMDLTSIKEQLTRRKQVEDMIKKLNEEKIQIQKLEALL